MGWQKGSNVQKVFGNLPRAVLCAQVCASAPGTDEKGGLIGAGVCWKLDIAPQPHFTPVL